MHDAKSTLKHDFVTSLSSITNAVPRWQTHAASSGSIPSAVLCLWVKTSTTTIDTATDAWLQWGQGWEVLLTLRPQTMLHHAGQVSFPGGVMEKSPENGLLETPMVCALRETEEEVGVEASAIQILGYLDPYHVKTGFTIQPLLAVAKDALNYHANRDEVACLLPVPWEHLADTRNWREERILSNDVPRQWYAFDWQGFTVWGATAMILYRSLEALASTVDYSWQVHDQRELKHFPGQQTPTISDH